MKTKSRSRKARRASPSRAIGCTASFSTRAVAALFDFVRATNRELDNPKGGGGAAQALAAFERVTGADLLDILPSERAVAPALARWVEERVAARNQARKSKDFKAADAIRAELVARGVEIEDTPTGTKWRLG